MVENPRDLINSFESRACFMEHTEPLIGAGLFVGTLVGRLAAFGRGAASRLSS